MSLLSDIVLVIEYVRVYEKSFFIKLIVGICIGRVV